MEEKTITSEKHKEIEADLEILYKLDSEVDPIVQAYNEALVYKKHIGASVPAIMNCIIQQRAVYAIEDLLSRLKAVPRVKTEDKLFTDSERESLINKINNDTTGQDL
jgi:hypothetical protein